MLNKVRSGLTAAIDEGTAYSGYAVRYCPDTRSVLMYERAIAELDGPRGPGWWMTCAGWNTNRTRQLLNALCLHVAGRQVLECRQLALFVDGVQIAADTWFPVAARTKESPH